MCYYSIGLIFLRNKFLSRDISHLKKPITCNTQKFNFEFTANSLHYLPLQCTESSVKNNRFCTLFSSPQKPGLIEGGHRMYIFFQRVKSKEISLGNELPIQK